MRRFIPVFLAATLVLAGCDDLEAMTGVVAPTLGGGGGPIDTGTAPEAPAIDIGPGEIARTDAPFWEAKDPFRKITDDLAAGTVDVVLRPAAEAPAGQPKQDVVAHFTWDPPPAKIPAAGVTLRATVSVTGGDGILGASIWMSSGSDLNVEPAGTPTAVSSTGAKMSQAWTFTPNRNPSPGSTPHIRIRMTPGGDVVVRYAF